MKEHDVTIGFILQATQKVADFLAGFDLNKFLQDEKTQSAVIMQLVVIGELAKTLPEETRLEIDLPWKLMAGFRDFAVHEYFKLDLNQVFDTAARDVPLVREKLEAHLKSRPA
jgi:uncharacterized protein with HEPN domain